MDLDENDNTLTQSLLENDRRLVSSPSSLEQGDVSISSNNDEPKRRQRQVPTIVCIVVPMIVLVVILFIAVVFIPPAAPVVVPAKAKSPLRVFVLAGQSNMVGHGFISKEDESGKQLNGTLESLVSLYNEQYGMLSKNKRKSDITGLESRRLISGSSSSTWTVRDDVLIACNHQRYDNPSKEKAPNVKGNLYAGMCGGDASQLHMGPELGFGWSVGDALNTNKKDDKILLAKIAWGGKSLENDFRPPSSGGSTGPYYTTMIEDIKAFLASVDKYFPEEHDRPVKLSGFAWHQGWNDLINTTAAADYEKNLANLIRDVRKDLNVSDLPFAIASSGMVDTNDFKKDGTKTAEEVVNAELAVATYSEFNNTVTAVDTQAFRRGPPPASPGDQVYHWNNNCESYWLIGKSLGNAMVDLVRWREKTNP